MKPEETDEIPRDRRAKRLAEICELVVQVMNLRPPQARALRHLSAILQRLPRPLSECSPETRREFLTEEGKWYHAAHPTFTFALATGIGKTRLAGAVMALLFLAKESRTFLLLAPRRAVLRRLSDAFDPQFREYIFVEPGLVPEPYVIKSDQIADPVGVEAALDMYRNGPTVYLLSPQLITTSERFRGQQIFTGRSPLEHLRAKNDLVVLVDEAHHVGGLGEAEAAKWTEAIRELKPALQFGMTATPRDGEGVNVLSPYPLAQALLEQLYTKDVHLLVRNFEGSLLGEEDIDLATIRYALDRLAVKEASMLEGTVPSFPATKPVCVFFARDIPHAEWVASILRDKHGLSDKQLLVTHSQSSKREDEVERLLSIEEIDNPVRVVVNVQELTEGWDVRNVYVVAPLRAMATFQGALQAMGRGLRLPAGRRVGQPELDSLDVVCFGKESLREIVEEATTWLGRGEKDDKGGVVIEEAGDGSRVAIPLEIPVRRDVGALTLVELEPAHHEVDLDVRPEAISRSARMAVDDLELVKLRSKVAKQKIVRVPRQAFVNATVMRVIRVASAYLSDDLHFGKIRELVEAWLENTKVGDDEVDFDPAEVGEEIGRIIVDGARKRRLDYQTTGKPSSVEFGPFSIDLVRTCEPGTKPPTPTIEELSIAAKATFSAGTVTRGYEGHSWELSLHAAYPFDGIYELQFAWLVDHDSEVDWWVRNHPKRLQIATPAGKFSPDFLVRMKDGTVYVIEVKDSFLWDPPDSEARVKSGCAARWAQLQTEISGTRVKFGVVLNTDVAKAPSFAAVLGKLRTE